EARYKAAVAAVEQAKAQIEKAQLGGRPAQQEAAAANIGAAQARLEGADYRLGRRTLTAPVTGRIEEVLYEPGELIPAGRPALAISPDDGIKVRFFVKEGRLPDLSVGNKVRVHLDGKDAPIEGVISYIATTAEYTPPVIFSNKTREKQVFLVEATLPPDEGAHPGLPAEVDW
ncbi:MAG: HlyD family secretion protein, partial [Parvularcula sp.]